MTSRLLPALLATASAALLLCAPGAAQADPPPPTDLAIVSPSPSRLRTPTIRATLSEPGYLVVFRRAHCLYGDGYLTALGAGTMSVVFSPEAWTNATTTFSVMLQNDNGSSQCIDVPGTYVHDELAPVSQLNLPSGWQAAPAAATLTATDADAVGGTGSGVATIFYTKGAAPPEPTDADAVYDPAAPPRLADGEAIRWFARDNLGNDEAPHGPSAAAQVDTTAPTTTDDVPGGWVATAPAARLTATDAQSGVATTYFTIGVAPATPTTASTVYNPAGPPTLNDGEKIRYFSVDAVGNAEAPVRSAAAKVDATAPLTTDSVTAASVPGPVTLTAADAQSGVATTYYTTGADPALPSTASAVYDPAARPALAVGEKIRYFSVDAVGNAETPRLSLAIPAPRGSDPDPTPRSDPPGPQPDPGVLTPLPLPGTGGTGITPPPVPAAKATVALAGGRTLKATRAGKVALSVSCRGARCTGTLRIAVAKGRKRTTIASARYAIAAGRRATVTATLTRAGRTLLARAPRSRLAVTVTLGGTSAARTLVRGR